MGTNYYVEVQPPCECCGRGYEHKHIGKSSAGWCFSLHVYPDEGINTLEDWKEYLKDKVIKNEYGGIVTLDELLRCITKRNHPSGLSRHVIDSRFCIGHGEGTWDYLIGDFS
jgi:hypothetical protein